MSFKEKWLLQDKTCPTCNQITERQRGITKQNVIRLVKPKWDMNELLITFMLIMIIGLAYSYNAETKQSRDWLKSMVGGSLEQCISISTQKCGLIRNLPSAQNISNENYTLPNYSLSNLHFSGVTS